MSLDTDTAHEILAACDRRKFLRRASLAGLAGVVAPAAASLFAPSRAEAAKVIPSPTNDAAILNFALNLEYLEAQFYTYAFNGTNIEAQGVGTTGTGTQGGVTIRPDGNTKVPFTTAAIEGYAAEIATDERNHVAFLRSALGANAVSQPQLDLYNSFNTLAQDAGIADANGQFNPFANEINFLLGAFIFEDVGVTAYHGAAPLLYTKAYLAAAAAIYTVEAFHASEVRTTLYNLSQMVQGNNIVAQVKAISDLRDKIDSAERDVQKDQGIFIDGAVNIVPANENSVVFARSTNQVLRIVYGMSTGSQTTPQPGLFFPNGMNGVIR